MAIQDKTPRKRQKTRDVPVGAIATAISTIFGLVAVFVSVQNEVPKLWNLSVALIAIVALVWAVWLWRSAGDATKVANHRPRRIMAAVIGIPALVLGILGIALNPTDDPHPESDPVPGYLGPPADTHEHEIREEGANVHFHRVARDRWAMTDFIVTLPYVRSIEVNVTGVDKVRLSLIRRTGPDVWQPIAWDEPPVEAGRAKTIFMEPIDVRADIGKKLFLQVFNVSQGEIRVYFTTQNINKNVQSYLGCNGLAASSLHRGEDLNALVIGWSRPG
jgi:hypothetical protein